MLPFSIQMALQGGGAKIVHLVAALEAVEKMRDDGRLRVTRLAGTSAGAIAGALFAAGIPMSTVKAELRAFRDKLDAFPVPTNLDVFSKIVLMRKPLAKRTALTALLTRLFKETKKTLVGDLGSYEKGRPSGPRMLIVSADLYTGTYHVAEDNENIVTALLDSCSIPFYFRVWNEPRGGIVDGGICENLPVAELRDEQDEYGPIVAVSFARRPVEDPASWAGYAEALLDTAIHNSVARALQGLSPEYVIPITTDLNTFDFRRALSDEGLGSMYDVTLRETELFFNNFMEVAGKNTAAVRGDLWANQNAATMQKLWSLYADVFGKPKFKIDSATYVVQANCLAEEGEPYYGSPDEATFTLVIHTGKEVIHAHKVTHIVSAGSSFLGQAVLSISGPPGVDKEIKPVLLPIASGQGDIGVLRELEESTAKHTIHELIAFFSPPLPANSGPFTLTFKEFLRNSAAPLKEGEDRLWLSKFGRADGLIASMHLVMLVPKSFGPVHVTAFSEKVKNIGEPIKRQQLEHYDRIGPPNFHAVGWRCTDADPDENFAMRIVKG